MLLMRLRLRQFSTQCVKYSFQQNVAVEEVNLGKPYSQVPGPKPLPVFGNTWRFLPFIGEYKIGDVADISQSLYNEYGQIVKLSGLIGRPDLLFVFDCDEAEKIFRNEGDTPHRPAMPCLVQYKTKERKEFFGDLPGVIGVHGEPWREFRTRVQKPILQPSVVKKYIPIIESVTNHFITRMIQMRDENLEMPADFDNEIHKWSLECIGHVALDVRLGCLDPNLPQNSEPQKIIDCAKFALRNVAILELKFPYWRYFPSTLWNRYISNMDYFREVCMKYINKSLSNLKSKSADSHDLSLLERILVNEKNPKIACILALDLILVGIDTISMAVCSMLYQLATRPEVQEKMHEELVRVLPDPKIKITSQHLDQMYYLKGFIREVLRMYSTVIGNGRVLLSDTKICGFNIPKGVQLVFPNIVMGRMKEYVGDAKVFKPERWIKSERSDPSNYVHPFASLPYGYGARMCLGRRFADLEMQLLLVKLVRSYKLEYLHEPLDYKVTFMYAPEGELKFKLTERT
ncbi:probable cytochrome P450 301a1, mitochondrial isoform X2 [Cimex lectularius]|nr:probable cytochrome P450 301a1, mitochondrial isoform X2 [Cimex lectularius]